MKKIFLGTSTLLVMNIAFASQVIRTEIDLDLDSNSCISSIPIDSSVANTVPKSERSQYLEQHYPDDASNPISGYDKSRGEGVPFRTTSNNKDQSLDKDLN